MSAPAFGPAVPAPSHPSPARRSPWPGIALILLGLLLGMVAAGSLLLQGTPNPNVGPVAPGERVHVAKGDVTIHATRADVVGGGEPPPTACSVAGPLGAPPVSVTQEFRETSYGVVLGSFTASHDGEYRIVCVGYEQVSLTQEGRIDAVRDRRRNLSLGLAAASLLSLGGGVALLARSGRRQPA